MAVYGSIGTVELRHDVTYAAVAEEFEWQEALADAANATSRKA